MPAYDVAAYIGEAVASVFNQRFHDFEIIVVNDGSPDTDALERALQPYRDRIVYLRQENLGAAVARNTALRAAQGEFVAFLDADDIWLPDFLSEQIGFLQRHPECDLVYCDALLFGTAQYEGRRYMEFAPSDGDVTFSALLQASCNVITSGVLAKRRTIVDAGGFDPGLRRGQDYDLWLRLARKGTRLAYQRKPLLRRRLHTQSLSGDALEQMKREAAVIEWFLDHNELSPHESGTVRDVLAVLRSNVCVERAKRLLAAGSFQGAAEELDAAIRLRSAWKLRLIRLGLRLSPRSLLLIQRWRTGNL